MALPSMAVSGAVKTMIAVTVSVHPAAAHEAGRTVTIKPGDTLSSISKRVYGSAADWPALWWTNRSAVRDPGKIAAGQRLQLSDWHPVKQWLTRAALAATAPAAAPQPATAAVSTAAPVSYTYNGASGSFQACVIARESGGSASAVNPYSGAGGLYGFLPSTWQALGYSGLPENAPVSVQNAAFAKEYAQSGGSAWSAYDGC